MCYCANPEKVENHKNVCVAAAAWFHEHRTYIVDIVQQSHIFIAVSAINKRQNKITLAPNSICIIAALDRKISIEKRTYEHNCHGSSIENVNFSIKKLHIHEMSQKADVKQKLVSTKIKRLQRAQHRTM